MFFCPFSDMQVPLQAFLDGKNGGKSIEIRSKVANVETGSGICPGKGKSFINRFFLYGAVHEAFSGVAVI